MLAHLIIKNDLSNALVTLVAAKENCLHEPFKTIETVRILRHAKPERKYQRRVNV